ncbi:MAG: hypothetical protein SWK76_05615 [Actinomycetota bacterium]|nr:hypothetical protein [Actinomycetota bacterium]
MGCNGFKSNEKAGKIFCTPTRGEEPGGANDPMGEELMELCHKRSGEGMDTSQIERFIAEGIMANSKGQTLYAQVMLQIAHDSLL